MQIPVNLTAGLAARVQVAGRYAAILSITGAASVGIRLRAGNAVLEDITTAGRGLSLLSSGPFDAVELVAASTCTVQLVVSDGRVQINTIEGATVSVTASTPLPVSNDRGSPGNLLHVAGVTLADAPATALANPGPVAVGSTAVQVAAANANRRALRIANLGPNPVALGPAGITWANRCQVLQVGDVWLEDRAANLAWSAICASGTSASVTTQEVTA